MDFELTESETDLAEGVRQLCNGRYPLSEIRRHEGAERVVDRERWQELASVGVFNLCLAEAAGGVGLGLTEAALVFEELGRALVPGPLVASHLSAGLVEGADDGSVLVGLVERVDLPNRSASPRSAAQTAQSAQAPQSLPVVVEHLDDIDVLLVMSDEGISSLDPRSLEATRLHRPMDPLTPVWTLAELPPGTPIAGPEIERVVASRRCGPDRRTPAGCRSLDD